MLLWDRLSPDRRSRHIVSLRISVAAMRAEMTPGAQVRNADFLPVYEAVIELLEREEARLHDVPWKPRSRARSLRRLALDFVVAALLLTPLDALQIARGIETAGSMPWLAPIRFGIVGLVLGLLAPSLDPRPRKRAPYDTSIDLALFVAAYLSTLLRSATPGLIAGIIGGIFLFALWRAYTHGIPWREIGTFVLLLGIGGPIVELVGVELGLFRYLGTTSIPLWLPILWATGAFVARDLFVGRDPLDG